VAGVCVSPYTNYVESSPVTAFVDACTIPGHTNVVVSADNVTAAITLPFTFRFYANIGTSAWVSSNGIVGFGSPTSTSFSPSCLPSTSAPRNSVFAFWDDLRTRVDGVCVGTLGAAPNRVQVLTWSDVYVRPDTTTHATFSVLLGEGTNTVDIVYQTLTGAGTDAAHATIGVQNQVGTIATEHSCSMAGLAAGTSIRFTPM
jgi:hypothetical protein